MKHPSITRKELAKMMDHSLLKPIITESEIIAGCHDAVRWNVASVCIRPSDVPTAASILRGTDVHLSTVIGFPHGTTTTATKMAESEQALAAGCVELDMVVNIGAVKSGMWSEVREDIRQIVELCHREDAKLKVIFENCYLEKDEKIKLCELCSELKVDWVKTSTGFGTGGATDNDLILMRKHITPEVQVKAAGGIRDLDRALRVHELGCTRFGCTVSGSILEAFERSCGIETAGSGS